jgi:hypothetical protein
MQFGNAQIRYAVTGQSFKKGLAVLLCTTAFSSALTIPALGQSTDENIEQNLASTDPTDLEQFDQETTQNPLIIVNENPLTDLNRTRLNTRVLSSTPTRTPITTSTITSATSADPADAANELATTENNTTTGIRLGSMNLRPTLQSHILYESEKTGTLKQSRVYNQTILGATLTSDWARHSLTLSGTGTIQKNITGTLDQDPSANINADFQYDINNLLTANLINGYNYAVEDRNAVSNATSQASIHSLTSSLALTKEIGVLRGSITGDVLRELHGDAQLATGTTVTGDDRNLFDMGLALRLQYAGNPVLMPFIEGEVRRIKYDQLTDASGTQRSYANYIMRLGVQADYSDKLNGDFSIGYGFNKFDDASLSDINSFVFASALNWSPRRGTDVNFGLDTTIEPSTSAGVSGSVLYAFNADLTQQIIADVNATLGFDYSFRDFTGSIATNNQNIFGANFEIDWAISRSVSLNSNIAYQKTLQLGASDRDTLNLGIGLTLAR